MFQNINSKQPAKITATINIIWAVYKSKRFSVLNKFMLPALPKLACLNSRNAINTSNDACSCKLFMVELPCSQLKSVHFLKEHTCATLSSFKIVIIFNNTSAEIERKSADVLLEIIIILKDRAIVFLKWTDFSCRALSASFKENLKTRSPDISLNHFKSTFF